MTSSSDRSARVQEIRERVERGRLIHPSAANFLLAEVARLEERIGELEAERRDTIDAIDAIDRVTAMIAEWERGPKHRRAALSAAPSPRDVTPSSESISSGRSGSGT